MNTVTLRGRRPDKLYKGPVAVALDFDGTLVHSRKFPAFGGFKSGAVAAWHSFEKAGLKVIVFTARRDKGPLWAFFYRHNLIPYKITSVKPKEAYAMIDDRAIRFEGNWATAYTMAMDQVRAERQKIAMRER